MLAREIAGRRYALAIMDIAREDSSYEAWSSAVDVLEAMTSESQYINALQSDGITDEHFVSIVRDVLADIGVKQLNLFRLLRSKRRLSLGLSIASYYRELLDEHNDIIRVTVRTAIELDDERQTKLKQQISEGTGKKVELSTIIDSTILGGMTIRIDDLLIDASTRTKLQSLRREFERAGR
jgi:F-type H+-transporting ATPase subunit delta